MRSSEWSRGKLVKPMDEVRREAESAAECDWWEKSLAFFLASLLQGGFSEVRSEIRELRRELEVTEDALRQEIRCLPDRIVL